MQSARVSAKLVLMLAVEVLAHKPALSRKGDHQVGMLFDRVFGAPLTSRNADLDSTACRKHVPDATSSSLHSAGLSSLRLRAAAARPRVTGGRALPLLLPVPRSRVISHAEAPDQLKTSRRALWQRALDSVFLAGFAGVVVDGAVGVAYRDPSGSDGLPGAPPQDTYPTAVVAGGCFWCMEHDLHPLKGAMRVRSGFAGGSTTKPNYGNYVQGGHVEAVEVAYDPKLLSYSDVLDYFWRKVDPLDGGGQFCDRGPEYRSVVFYKTEEEKQAAENLKSKLSGELGQPIVTDVLPLVNWYPAGAYQQRYSEKNPVKYNAYRSYCGRDKRVDGLWGGKAGKA